MEQHRNKMFSAKQILFFFFLGISCGARAQAGYASFVWQSDNGDGNYKNPVIYSDYSDQDVIHVGDDYYLIASGFNYMPGLLSQVSCAVNGAGEIVNEQANVAEPELWLRVNVAEPTRLCHFSYSTIGTQFKNIGTAFTALQGKWIGAKPGLFCTGAAGTRTGSYADIDWFRLTNN